MKHPSIDSPGSGGADAAGASERTSLLASASTPEATHHVSVDAHARAILLSSTLSRLGSRSWEFAAPLLVLSWSPGSLTAPALLGLACALSRAVVSPWLGGKADGWNRMHTVLVGTGMQALGCLVSVGALVIWNELLSVGDSITSARIISLVVVVTAGVVETLGAQLASVAVKKEWVPIVFDARNRGNTPDAGDDTTRQKTKGGLLSCIATPTIDLAFMNTTMTNIDLVAAMVGPIVAGWILQILSGKDGSMQRGFAVIALINAVSFVPEVILLKGVYNSCPALQRHRAEVEEDDLQRSGIHNPHNENDSYVDGEHTSNRGAGHSNITRSNSNETNPWRIWIDHPSGLPLLTLSLASLYLTALSPSGVVLTAYLITIGLSPSAIGMFRAVGALAGVVGIALFSLFRHWGETDAADNMHIDETVAAAERAASAKSIERLRRVSLAFLLSEVVSVLMAAAAFALCQSSNIMEDASFAESGSSLPWQIVLFMGSIVASRAGLYSFDVGVLEIEQYVIDERYRNAVGSVEGALCSLAEMGMYILSIALPDPSDFGWQVGVSATAGNLTGTATVTTTTMRTPGSRSRIYANSDITSIYTAIRSKTANGMV
ncbi:hypothetical protein ACHAXT_007330 [Thalassiosira profunda]